MGDLTLADLKDELKRGLGNRSDMDTRLTRFLNIAQNRIARLHDYEEMQRNTTSAFVITPDILVDKYLSFPLLREIHSFRLLADARAIKLKGVSTRMFDKFIPMPEFFSRDTPSHYTKWSAQLEIWPVPDSAYPYAIRWTAWPTTLSDSSLTAVSDFIAKDDLLIALSTAYAFDALGKVQDAQRKYQLASSLMNESMLMDSKEPDREFAPATEVFGENQLRPDYWVDPFQLRDPV